MYCCSCSRHRRTEGYNVGCVEIKRLYISVSVPLSWLGHAISLLPCRIALPIPRRIPYTVPHAGGQRSRHDQETRERDQRTQVEKGPGVDLEVTSSARC